LINDYLEIENSEGMPNLSDSAIALEFIMSVKTGVRNLAIAVTEAASPEVKSVLRKQLNLTLDLHDDLSQLMVNKGWLYPYDVNEQFMLDMKSAEMAARIGGWKLFPEDTSRLGTFATPYK